MARGSWAQPGVLRNFFVGDDVRRLRLRRVFCVGVSALRVACRRILRSGIFGWGVFLLLLRAGLASYIAEGLRILSLQSSIEEGDSCQHEQNFSQQETSKATAGRLEDGIPRAGRCAVTFVQARAGPSRPGGSRRSEHPVSRTEPDCLGAGILPIDRDSAECCIGKIQSVLYRAPPNKLRNRFFRASMH